MKTKRKHALVLPIVLQAHFAGIYRLAVELARKGVKVTFVCPMDMDMGSARIKEFKELQELDFNVINFKLSIPSAELSWERFLKDSKKLLPLILTKLMADQKAGLPLPNCLIADRLVIWGLDLSKELNIPFYQFFSCGATYTRSSQACSRLLADGTLPVTEADPEGIRYLGEFEGLLEIPGLPALRCREMTCAAYGADIDMQIGSTIGEADGVIVNTYYELEAPAIDAIRQTWKEDSREKNHNFFAVGPLSNVADFKDLCFLANLDKRGVGCLQFLDSRPSQSVLYICLGSIVSHSPQHIHDLALAIEASEQSFLWVLPRGREGALPPDFEARIRSKGSLFVSGWVPQLQILAHPSIGGFMTHCGWNSSIEGISSGVPLVAWPQMRIDQFINCRYFVDVLKVAVEVHPTFEGEVATIATNGTQRKVIHEEIVKAMRLLMSEEGNSLRSSAQELKKAAEAAIAEGGARQKALDALIESIPPLKQ